MCVFIYFYNIDDVTAESQGRMDHVGKTMSREHNYA